MEDTYKVLFYLMDQGLYALHKVKDMTQLLHLASATPPNTKWAEPITYKQALEVTSSVLATVVCNTYMSLAQLLNQYLKVMCARVLTVAPFDDSWYSFDQLATLSGIKDIESVARYPSIVKMMEFHKMASSYDYNQDAKVNHLEIMANFDAILAFAKDFEYAFLLANPNAREEEL